MKKILSTILFSGLAVIPSIHAYGAAPGNRVFYAFNLGSAEWAEGPTKRYDCGFVSYPFDLSEKGTVLKSYLEWPNNAVYAGAGIEGIIYACEYTYSSSSNMPEPGDFLVYNIFNGTLERRGKWNPEKSSMKPSDMTYSVADGKLYAMAFENGSGLYEVDSETGKFTLICSLTSGGTIAADGKGNLYTIDSGGTLYSIDKERGRMTKLWHTGLSGMMANQSMEFDLTTGLLYWGSQCQTHPLGAENVFLQEIDLHDLNNITMKDLGNVGSLSRIVAMHIPFADNIDAPAAPTDISSIPDVSGELKTTIYWTNPITAFGGGEIGTLYGCTVKRNGEQVAYLDNLEPGAKMEWTDTSIPEKGNYRYDIQLINGKGNGAKGTVFQFAGPDKPEAVKNIKGEVSDDLSSITLSWDAPTTGAHLGAFNLADVTYKVVRNDNAVIAEGLKEPKVTDNSFVRLLNYNYTIYAVNEEGETGTISPSFIVGPAMELPLDQTFENPAQVTNRWTLVDGNADTYSWMIGTDLAHAVFGDYELCIDYITSPTLGNEDDADEWLISPPLKMEAGREYMVLASARSYSTLDGIHEAEEIIDIHFGKKNTVESMGEKIDTFKVGANDTDPDTGTMKFVDYIAKLPVLEEDGVRCVGLHLTSPLMKSGYLQMNNIYIGDLDLSGVNEITGTAPASWSLNGKMLLINGIFKEAALYNAAGLKAVSIRGALTDLSGIAPGIYLLTIDGKTSKLVIR